MSKLKQILAIAAMMGGENCFGRYRGYAQGDCEVCGKKNVKAGRETGKYLCFKHLQELEKELLITQNKLEEFFQKWEGGEFPHLRLGQAFYNTFHKDLPYPFPELFYANEEKAREIIKNLMNS